MTKDNSKEKYVEIFPVSDTAIMVQLGEKIDLITHQRVKSLAQYLNQQPFTGMLEYIPAFTTITIFYDPLRLSAGKVPAYEIVCSILEEIVANLRDETNLKAKIIEIPVCYGGDFGPDLEYVALHNGLKPEEVIKIHSDNNYLVYMIGFAPGFPYLGGMSKKIAVPRRNSPRLVIPAGSVGIAGEQTGVYSIETPGGWQLIGRTPLALFQLASSPPSLLQAGDIVKFQPISRQEYEELERRG